MKRGKIIRLPFDLLWMRLDTRKCVVVELYWLGIYIGLLLFSVNLRSPFLYRLVSCLLRLRWNFKNIIHSRFGLSNLIKRRSYRRGFISWTALPIFLFMGASIAIAVYSYNHLEEIGGLVAIVIISIAAIVAMWNAESLSKLWLYRPWNLGLSKILLAAVIVALLGCTTAAYSDIEPYLTAKIHIENWFSSAGDKVASWFETKPINELENEVMQLINTEREDRGIRPIIWDESMRMGARNHSENMLEKGSLFHAFGPFAECCFMSGSTWASAKDIVEGWMSSTTGHREILLDPQYLRGVVGIARNGALYATYRCY